MWNKQTSTWRFLLALLLSLLLHVAALSGARLDLPELLSGSGHMEVVLLDAPKPAAAPVKPVMPAKPAVRKRIKPVSEPALAPVAAATEAAKSVEPTLQPAPVVAEPTIAATQPSEPQPEVEESLAERGFRRATLEYRLLRKGGALGRVKYEYHNSGEGTYSIISTAEASGLVSLFVHGQYVQQSEGRITPRGLRPDRFSYQRGDDESKNLTANFNWQSGQIDMGSSDKRTTVALPENAQDQLSFMYQFMFVQPLAQMQLTITNGKRLRTYYYQFEGEETLKTDIGDVRALHITKRDNDDGKLELWLAPDYRYLPVKISQTEKDGTVTDQLITLLKAEE